MPESYRIAIVGAGSLRGKELSDSLSESAFAASEVVLMDDDSALGQLEAVGDEVTFIQKIEPGSFERMDFAMFTGAEDVTLKHWQTALAAGASILDLSYALDQEPNVLVRSPWVREEMNGSGNQGTPDLRTAAIVPAHPAAVVLALLLARLKKAGAVRSAWATILEPASEYGRAAMDELHQQTVTLLSFQTLPKDIYDAQVAFNCVPVLGENAKINLAQTESRIRRHYALLSGGRLPQVGIQLIHAPVFHGHNFSTGDRDGAAGFDGEDRGDADGRTHRRSAERRRRADQPEFGGSGRHHGAAAFGRGRADATVLDLGLDGQPEDHGVERGGMRVGTAPSASAGQSAVASDRDQTRKLGKRQGRLTRTQRSSEAQPTTICLVSDNSSLLTAGS